MAEQFEIAKEVVKDFPNCKIFKFKVIFKDNRPEGDACIFYRDSKL